MSTTSTTRDTYDQIARDYAQNTQQRQQLMAAIERFVALVPPQGLILDIGCGPGFDSDLLRQRGMRVIGVDYSWNMMQSGVSEFGLAGTYVQADMRRLPFTQAADGLWACASFLHIPREEAQATLNGFAKVLREDGILYISVKLGSSEAWSNESYGRELGRYFVYWQPEQLDQALDGAGFETVSGWLEDGSKDRWLVRIAQRRSAVE